MRDPGFNNPCSPWVRIRDFLDDWYAADQETRRKMLEEEPPETGERRFDACLAALAPDLLEAVRGTLRNSYVSDMLSK